MKDGLMMIEGLETRRLMAFLDPVTAFGSQGYAATNYPITGSVILEQSDGKLLTLVDRHNDAFGENLDIVRFNKNGTIDTTFGINGFADPGFTPAQLFQASDGRILGTFSYDKSRGANKPLQYAGAFRLNSDGSLDYRYGNKGVTAVQVAVGWGFALMLDYHAAANPDGSLYIASTQKPYYASQKDVEYATKLFRLNSSGALDTTWGKNGFAAIQGDPTGTKGKSFARSIDHLIARGDGTLLVAGTEDYISRDSQYGQLQADARYAYLDRFTASGVVDSRFANNGEYKVLNPQAKQFEPAPLGLIQNPDFSLIFSFRAYGRQQYFELSARGKTSSKISDAGVWDTYEQYGFSLNRTPDGRLLRGNGGSIAEVRKLSDGRWEQQPFRKPTKLPTGVVAALYETTVLKDGSIIAIGSKKIDADTTINGLLKLSPGSGTDKRDDFIPGAQQNVITLSSDGNGNYATNVFFFDATNKTLGFRRRDANGYWSKTQTIDATPNAGVYLDALGESVAYTDGTNGDLKYATRQSDGTFKIETVDTVGSTGLYPSISTDNTGGIVVAYYQRSRGDLRLAHRSTAGKWTIETVDSVGDVGRIPKLVLKSHNNKLAIAYATNGDRSIRLAEAGIGKSPWTFAEVAATTGGVGKIDLEYEGYDFEFGPFDDGQLSAYVGYYDAGPADLVIAERKSLGQAFTGYRVNTPGAVGMQFDVQDGGATLFYDRTRNRIISAVLGGTRKTAAVVNDYITLNGAGPFFSTINNNSRYNLTMAWYDTVKAGLQIRDTGWYQ